MSYKIENSKVIRKVSQLKKLAMKMKGLQEFAYDTETNTLRVYAENKNFKLVGISISWGKYHNYYIPSGHYFEEDQLSPKTIRKYLKPIFGDKFKTIIGHNIKFDMHVLARIGISIETPNIFDTMVASWICDENSPNGLKENSQMVLGIKQEHFGNTLATVTKEQKALVGLKASQKPTFDLVSIENGSPYALDDAYYTWELYLYYLDRLGKEGMEKIYYSTYPQFIRTLFNMEERGITVDVEKLTKMGVDMQKDLDDLEYEMLEIVGVHINLNSTAELSKVLFGYIKEPVDPRDDRDFRYEPEKTQKTKVTKYEKAMKEYEIEVERVKTFTFDFPIVSSTAKGAPQVTGDILEAMAKKEYKTKRKKEGIEFCKMLVQYKKLKKLKTAFVDGLLEQLYDDGKAHPSFNPVGTDSGRISCSAPNLMQLPNANEDDKYQIRDCFIGSIDENTGERKDIISVDYSNLEVRVIAHFSKDPNLIHAFEQGKDLHGNTAKMMFMLDCDANDVKKLYPDLRQQGKVIAFLLQYGGGAKTLCDDLNKDGELDKIASEQGKDKKSPFYGCRKAIDVAQRLMDLYFEGFQGIANFMKSQKKFAHRHEYVNTLVGRKRRLPDINSNNFGTSAYCERLSINACIQGSGADIMINAQNRIEGTSPCNVTSEYMEEYNTDKFIASERLKELDCDMLVQIHDELLFECPPENCEEAIAIIRDCMIHPFGEKVKLNLDLEVGSGHGHSYQVGH